MGGQALRSFTEANQIFIAIGFKRAQNAKTVRPLYFTNLVVRLSLVYGARLPSLAQLFRNFPLNLFERGRI
jgi:hypothetical protein